MKTILAAALALLGFTAAANAATIDRLYVMDCGHGHALDKARWSPGVDVGVKWEVSDNCYLIKHGSDWMLWDTGVVDSTPATATGPNTGLLWDRPKKLADQFAQVGVKPDDIKYVAVSHIHPDHIGNVDMFPKSTLVIQTLDWNYAFEGGKKPFNPDRPVMKLDSDLDLFRDGSVELVQTPGHTPGHQSLLVHLRQNGWILLTGDAVHFKSQFDFRRVPAGNTDHQATLVSMDRLAALMAAYHAKMWINHDAAQTATLRHSPAFYN